MLERTGDVWRRDFRNRGSLIAESGLPEEIKAQARAQPRFMGELKGRVFQSHQLDTKPETRMDNE
jgi:hypothetical protein